MLRRWKGGASYRHIAAVVAEDVGAARDREEVGVVLLVPPIGERKIKISEYAR